MSTFSSNLLLLLFPSALLCRTSFHSLCETSLHPQSFPAFLFHRSLVTASLHQISQIDSDFSKMIALTFAACIVAVSALNGIVVPAFIQAGVEFQTTFENANDDEYRIYVAAALLGSNGPTCTLSGTGTRCSKLTSRRLPRQLHHARRIDQFDCPRRRRSFSRLLLHCYRRHHHPTRIHL